MSVTKSLTHFLPQSLQGVVSGSPASSALCAHGGGINVSSTPGAGTTFQILFPVVTDPQVEEGRDIITQEPIRLAGKLILLIDDEDDVRQVTAEILNLSEIRTIDAANGRVGLQLFQQHMDEVDLVLLDLSMPGMGGAEVVQRLRALKADVPVILLSGYGEYEVTRRLGSNCQLSFLQKPYNVDGLLQAIEQQLSTTVACKITLQAEEMFVH